MSLLTNQQERFAAELARLSGLDRNVIRAWALAEMSGSYAQQREREGNANVLNVGYFDSGPSDWARNAFRDPAQAARLTYDFLRGRRWGAAPGIQAILRTAGQNPSAQLRAIWTSPWASSRYNNGRDLLDVYRSVSGAPAPALPGGTGSGAPSVPGVGGADAAPVPASPAVDQRGALVTRVIGENAKLAGIPTISVPEVSAPVQVDTPQARATGVPDVSPAGAGGAIVAAAKQFLGMPYSWGGGGAGGPSYGIGRGANTKGFDCSGLVQYALGKAGVKIARVTNDQVRQGRAVPARAARPGDLIFFGTWENPHHVGIYLGGGKFIHAPSTGDVVKISALADRNDVLTIRRYTR